MTIVDVSVSTPYYIRFVWSGSDFASGLAAENIACTVVKFDNINPTHSAGIPWPFDTYRKIPYGYKIWAQCKNATNLSTVDFFVGLKGY